MTSTNNAVNKRTVLFVATLASFLTPFMGSSINIALPSIGREFSMNAILLSGVATSYLLAAAMLLVPFGRLADIHGRKKVFACGILFYTFSSFLCAISTSAGLLICSRFLQGIGSAAIFGTSVAILTSVFPAGERGRALGIQVAAVYSGLSFGPFLGGFLTQHFGWRTVFLVNLPIGLAIITLVYWKLKGEWANAKGESFDFVGSAVYSLSLVALMLGFSLLRTGWGRWLIPTGALGIASFITWEMRAKFPILNMNLFRNNTVFAFSNLAAFINYGATSAVGFLLSLYLQYIKALSPQNAGLILVSQPIIMALLSPLTGRLSDRVEPRVVASAGMGVTVVGLLLLARLTESTPLGFIVAVLLLLGLGFALFSSPNTNAVMSSAQTKFYGVASATLGTMRLTGQTLSIGIATLIFAVKIGGVQLSPDCCPSFLASVRTSFAVFAVLCLAGVFASLARGRVR